MLEGIVESRDECGYSYSEKAFFSGKLWLTLHIYIDDETHKMLIGIDTANMPESILELYPPDTRVVLHEVDVLTEYVHEFFYG